MYFGHSCQWTHQPALPTYYPNILPCSYYYKYYYTATTTFMSPYKRVALRAHLDYVTQPCDIRHMTILLLFKNELGLLKTKSPPYPLLGPPPPPDFVLRGPKTPNPLLKVIKLSCV